MSNATELVKIELEKYFKKEKWLKDKKRNEEYAKIIEETGVKNISFGSRPVLEYGYIIANATAEGERTQNNCTSTRTVSFDFTTREAYFVKSGSDKILKKAKDYNLYFCPYKNTMELAKYEGEKLCRQSMNDVNFYMTSYRINRLSLIKTRDDYYLPIWPINLNINFKNKRSTILIGYYVEKEGKIHIDFDIHVPMTPIRKILLLTCIIIIIIILLALI